MCVWCVRARAIVDGEQCRGLICSYLLYTPEDLEKWSTDPEVLVVWVNRGLI